MYIIYLSQFIICLFLIFYTYVGYNIVLLLTGLLSGKRSFEKDEAFEPFPNVTFLIAAYNEEKVINSKLDNLLNLEYPKEKISIYVVSDSSSDKTHEIVNSYHEGQVHLIISPERRGKTHCENLALKHIKDSYIVFTDASTLLESSCLNHLIKHFVYKQVGCVSTRDKSVTSDSNKGENLYVRYEMSTRTLETKVDSLVGLSGSCYAARKKLCSEIPDHLTRDFALPMIAREMGYISVDEPDALCYVNATNDINVEFKRKVRTFTNGIFTLIYKKNLLNISKYGKFSFMLWSHKVLRWSLPFFFIGAFVMNAILYSYKNIFKLFFIIQIIGYIFSTIGFIFKSNNLILKISRIIFFICITNAASLLAWYNIFKGDKFAKWNPTKR